MEYIWYKLNYSILNRDGELPDNVKRDPIVGGLMCIKQRPQFSFENDVSGPAYLLHYSNKVDKLNIRFDLSKSNATWWEASDEAWNLMEEFSENSDYMVRNIF